METFREATMDDEATLLALMREFAASQGYPFDEVAAPRALRDLLASREAGRVWLILSNGLPRGYLVLTLGFSLEYGGRDAFIDELFLEAAARGRGLGRQAVAFALDEAARLGVRAVHLESDRENDAAGGLYRSLGFTGNNRQLLTRRLSSVARPADGLRP